MEFKRNKILQKQKKNIVTVYLKNRAITAELYVKMLEKVKHFSLLSHILLKFTLYSF